jgi:hypothetical protein
MSQSDIKPSDVCGPFDASAALKIDYTRPSVGFTKPAPREPESCVDCAVADREIGARCGDCYFDRKAKQLAEKRDAYRARKGRAS